MGDKIAEPTETFTVVLSNPVNATIGDGTGVVTILDDDSSLVANAAPEQAQLGVTVSSADAVASALADAEAAWISAGADLSALHGVTIAISDLPGLTLGGADGTLIRLDADAAGWGWSLDGVSPGIDLREVLEHELGHLLGFSHGDETRLAVMGETLEVTARADAAGPLLAPAGSKARTQRPCAPRRPWQWPARRLEPEP